MAQAKSKAKSTMGNAALAKPHTAELKKLPTVSARIRYLDSIGVSRGDSSRILSSFEGRYVRYQWVRNVLETNVKTPKV